MKELICITCPKGCHLKVDEQTFAVTGNACERGAAYGAAELQNPVRVVTSTVRISGAIHRRMPVKTSCPVPKGKIFEIMRQLDDVQLHAPVCVGSVIISNVAGTDADIVATKTMPKEDA